MVTSSNGNIFRVTGHLCGEFTGPRWIPRTKSSGAEILMFSLMCVWINDGVNNREAGDLRRYRAHDDVIVMFQFCSSLISQRECDKDDNSGTALVKITVFLEEGSQGFWNLTDRHTKHETTNAICNNTSASSSTDADALKFRLVKYDKFYGGQNEEDASECLTMLIELINKGSVQYCGSNDNNSIGVSLSEILFSFMLAKYIVCDACGLRPSLFESSSVLHITPAYTSTMQEFIMQGMQQKWVKSCFPCKKNTWHVESNYIWQVPKYLVIVVNRFRYINNNLTKDGCSIPMDMTVVLGLH